MAESGTARNLRLEYRFDRLLRDKLAQAYLLLVPDKRRPVGGMGERIFESPEPITEIRDEQTSRHLRTGLFGSPDPLNGHAADGLLFY